MTYIKKPLFLLFFLLIAIRVNSQTEVLKGDGAWFTMTNKFQISDNFYAGSFIQFRGIDIVKSQFFFAGASLSYKFKNNLSVGVGYMYITAFTHGANHPVIPKHEHRILERIGYKSKIGSSSLAHRFVFEQRFKEKIVIEDDLPHISGTTYAQRFRYRIEFTFNILKLKNEKYLLGKISEELRIRFKSGLSDPDFDQNNFYLYTGYQLMDNSKIWLGYGVDYFKINSEKYISNKVLLINFSYDFDFRKKIK